DQNIDAAESLHSRMHHRLHRGLVLHIRGHAQGLHAKLLQGRGRLCILGRMARRNDDVSASARQPTGNAVTNATVATGHNSHSASQIKVWCHAETPGFDSAYYRAYNTASRR